MTPRRESKTYTPIVCGVNAHLIPFDRVGCGKPIEKAEDVRRCDYCDIPFHLECLARHLCDTGKAH